MVQLLSGKVLALQNPDAPSPGHQYGDGLKTEIFDPSSASGSWSPGPLAPEDQEGDVPTVNTTVLIQGTPAECAPRCGDVLVGLLGVPGQWDLYDPTPAPAGTFTPLPHANHEYRTRDAYARAVQITGTAAQCGANCGKVLIVGGSESGQQITYAELYDPKANTFAVSGQYNPALADAILVRLTDGRVLSVSSRAQMFDPRDGKFSDAATPNFNHDGTYNEGLMLGNGDVLFTGYDDMGLQSVEVYSPSHDTWTEVPSCLPLVECHLYGTLPNGQALARSQGGLSSGRTGGAATTFLFDPNRRVWTPTGQLADAKAGYAAVLLSRGACAPNCNRVLAAGAADVPAEMYTP